MFGYEKPSLTLRIGWGKFLGLVSGIVGFASLPMFVPDIDMNFRLGIMFWYATLGVMIGFGGIYARHPVINLKLPWWWRGAIFGAWFNFVLMLFTYDKLAQIMSDFAGAGSVLASPWWIVVEGAIMGMILDGFLTALGGEGPQAVDQDK